MKPSLELAFEKMAKTAAYDLIGKSDVVGLGSGSTVANFAKTLGDRVRLESLDLTIVPSSMQSWLLARANGLRLVDDSAHCPKEIDVAVDGADQISVVNRALIKGGGGALLKEKIIISSAKKCFIMADESKYVQDLNRSVPVEVTQFSVLRVEHELRKTFRADPVLRKLDKGYPFFTESGNLILDCQFPEAISNPSNLGTKIKMIPGVIEAGIFTNSVDRFYKVNQDGTFETL